AQAEHDGIGAAAIAELGQAVIAGGEDAPHRRRQIGLPGLLPFTRIALVELLGQETQTGVELGAMYIDHPVHIRLAQLRGVELGILAAARRAAPRHQGATYGQDKKQEPAHAGIINRAAPRKPAISRPIWRYYGVSASRSQRAAGTR